MANGDLWRTNDRGPSLVCWARRAGRRDFYPAFGALVSPEQNILFPTAHFFILSVPTAQQAGQAVVPGRLSLNLFLWVRDEQILPFATIISASSGVYCKGIVQYDVFKFKTFPNGASDSL